MDRLKLEVCHIHITPATPITTIPTLSRPRQGLYWGVSGCQGTAKSAHCMMRKTNKIHVAHIFGLVLVQGLQWPFRIPTTCVFGIVRRGLGHCSPIVHRTCCTIRTRLALSDPPPPPQDVRKQVALKNSSFCWMSDVDTCSPRFRHCARFWCCVSKSLNSYRVACSFSFCIVRTLNGANHTAGSNIARLSPRGGLSPLKESSGPTSALPSSHRLAGRMP